MQQTNPPKTLNHRLFYPHHHPSHLFRDHRRVVRCFAMVACMRSDRQRSPLARVANCTLAVHAQSESCLCVNAHFQALKCADRFISITKHLGLFPHFGVPCFPKPVTGENTDCSARTELIVAEPLLIRPQIRRSSRTFSQPIRPIQTLSKRRLRMPTRL